MAVRLPLSSSAHGGSDGVMFVVAGGRGGGQPAVGQFWLLENVVKFDYW